MLEQKAESTRDTTDGTRVADEVTGSTASTGWVRWCRCMAYDMIVVPLVSSRHPPWYDARGVSMGLIVGFAVPVGAQLIALGFLRSFIRFNLIVAAAFSFVSNPLDMIPLYYGYYHLGSFVLGKTVAIDFSVFRKLMHPISNSTYFWEATAAFANLSKEFLASWVVAAIILSVVSGIIGYVVTYQIQQKRCIRKAKKMGLEYGKFLDDLEKQFRLSECTIPTRIAKKT